MKLAATKSKQQRIFIKAKRNANLIATVAFALLGLNIMLAYLIWSSPPGENIAFDGVALIQTADGRAGTAFLIGEKLLLTAGHVVENASSVSVVFKDGSSATGKVEKVKYEPQNLLVDAATISLSEPRDSNWILALGDSNAVREGERIKAPGYGGDGKYDDPSGTVSALQEGVLVSDVDINPGHSGAPLYSLDQKAVVGLIVAGPTRKGAMIEGKKVAVRINHIKNLFPEIK